MKLDGEGYLETAANHCDSKKKLTGYLLLRCKHWNQRLLTTIFKHAIHQPTSPHNLIDPEHLLNPTNSRNMNSDPYTSKPLAREMFNSLLQDINRYINQFHSEHLVYPTISIVLEYAEMECGSHENHDYVRETCPMTKDREALVVALSVMREKAIQGTSVWKLIMGMCDG